MQDIREILSAEMDALRDKKTTPGAANALCNTTGKFLSTIKLEMEFCKMIGKQPAETFLRLMAPSKSELPAGNKAPARLPQAQRKAA